MQRYNDSLSVYNSLNYVNLTRFNITQDSINEYMTNLTIAALTLNVATSKTQVQTSEYRTTYEFSAPINIFLPYALCLAFGAAFVAIGIWSLAQNGSPAADGGFLQVMTTTVGRTQMEELAIALQTGDNPENITKELLNLRVRYGELIDGAGIRTGSAGFGTEQET